MEGTIFSARVVAIVGAVGLLSVTSCADSAKIEAHGESVRILTVSSDADMVQDTLTTAQIEWDPTTHCVVDEAGHPVVFPQGTTVSGSGENWSVKTPEKHEISAGSRIRGAGEPTASAKGLGDLPDECGPPPWNLFKGSLDVVDQSGPDRAARSESATAQ